MDANRVGLRQIGAPAAPAAPAKAPAPPAPKPVSNAVVARAG
jgi:hypothetical protein